jgi:hypothetical protein
MRWPYGDKSSEREDGWMTENDQVDDATYEDDLKDDAAAEDTLPEPTDPAQVPLDEGDAGESGVAGGAE